MKAKGGDRGCAPCWCEAAGELTLTPFRANIMWKTGTPFNIAAGQRLEGPAVGGAPVMLGVC